MRGLFLKDIYILRENFITGLIGIIIVGLLVSIIVPSGALIPMVACGVSATSVNTILLDKNAKWDRMCMTMPVTKREIILSKYLLYGIVCIVGIVIGMILALILGGVNNTSNGSEISEFIGIAIGISLIAGAISIPFYIFLTEERAPIGLILSYTVAAIVTVVIMIAVGYLVEENLVKLMSVVSTLIISIIIYTISFVMTNSFYNKKDI